MNARSRLRSGLYLAAASTVVSAIISSHHAYAATYTWSGAGSDGNWSTAQNWNPAGAPPLSDATTVITLTGSTGTSVNADGNYSIGELVMDRYSSAFTLSGQALNLSGVTSGSNAYGIYSDSNSAVIHTVNNAVNLLSNMQFRANRASSLVINGSVNLNANTLTLYTLSTGSGGITINGAISGTGNISVTSYNGQNVYLNAASTYTGKTQVSIGTLVVGNNQALGAPTDANKRVTLGNSGLNGAAGLLVANGITLARTIVVSASSGTASYTIGGYQSASGTIGSASDVITLGSAADSESVQLVANGSGVITIASSIKNAAAGGTGSVTKTGTGTVLLNGTANDYGGQTYVNQGTLLVNGVLSAGGGDVSVASGAAFGGSGVVGRNVVVQDGGALSPDGTLTLASLTLSANSVLNFDISGAGSDQLVITDSAETLFLGTLNLHDLGAVTPGTYQLFTNSGGGTMNYEQLQIAGLADGWSFDRQTGSLVVAAVPEPASLLLISTGVLGLIGRRRQFRR